MVTDRKAKAGPHVPPEYNAAIISAFQALERGDCPAHLQQMALKWLIEAAAGTYEPTYWPGDPAATTFAEGKRHVGLQVVKMLNLNPKAFTQEGR